MTTHFVILEFNSQLTKLSSFLDSFVSLKLAFWMRCKYLKCKCSILIFIETQFNRYSEMKCCKLHKTEWKWHVQECSPWFRFTASVQFHFDIFCFSFSYENFFFRQWLTSFKSTISTRQCPFGVSPNIINSRNLDW